MNRHKFNIDPEDIVKIIFIIIMIIVIVVVAAVNIYAIVAVINSDLPWWVKWMLIFRGGNK